MEVPPTEMAETYSDWKINCNLTEKREGQIHSMFSSWLQHPKQYAAICSDATKNPLLS